ncbi:FliL family protein [Phycisphaera mikurensis]|uniref:FliL family protein n=1 Tax=Phycisphaera mikurensis (strain NBRC 102666 / KCTC 22515 / FYK2301M01) TaxID=1142394 RepID=I0IGX7_PHYMF|nr:FliL family protein [Phycisphaera mikurensis]MBB6440772.1 flagellar basal body-associated protein FliL [Phycisphaera mikurensis]BAM04515.1 FliL family protein [Phycisphaera mikurensis NBRC 102666]
MAEESDKSEKSGGGEEPAKKKLPLVPIIVVAAMLIGEAAVVAGMFMFLGGPAEVQADPAVTDELAEGARPLTLPVLATKFQNKKSGESFLYDVEIFATTQKKHEEDATRLLEEKKAAIQFEVMVIFRKAEPAFLREASLQTLTRQIRSVVQEAVGNVPGTDEPYFDDVILGKCTEFAEF